MKEITPDTPKPTEEDLEHQESKKSVLLLLGKIMQNNNAHLFISPVNEAASPEYRNMVYRPMNLGSVKENIDSGHIQF